MTVGRRGRDLLDLAWAGSGRRPGTSSSERGADSIVAYLRFFGTGSLQRFLSACEGFY